MYEILFHVSGIALLEISFFFLLYRTERNRNVFALYKTDIRFFFV